MDSPYIMMNDFPGKMVLLRFIEIFPFWREITPSSRSFYCAVYGFYSNAAFFIKLLSCFAYKDFFFYRDIHRIGLFQNIVKKNKVWRIKKPCTSIIGRTIKFICNFVRDKTEKMDVFFYPFFKVFSGKINDRCFCKRFDGNGSFFHACKNRHFAYKVNRFIFFNHIDISHFQIH